MGHPEAIGALVSGYVDECVAVAVGPLVDERDALEQDLVTVQRSLAVRDDELAAALGDVASLKGALGVANARIAELEKPVVVSPPAPEPAPVSRRPKGDGYVEIESLGVPVNGAGLRKALATDLKGKILTLPDGVFEAADFSYANGVYWVHNGVGGLVGSEKTELGIIAGSSTKAGQVPTANGSTNPFYILVANDSARGKFVLGNIHFRESKAGHLHGGAQIRTNSQPYELFNLTGFAFSPGNMWYPPGETFGINLWRCSVGGEMRDIKFDGGNVCSSLIGFNNVDNSRTYRVDLSASPYGMITWWQCRDVYTEDIKSYGGHAGINHERVGGTVHHVRPHLFPDRAKFPNAMHLTFNSDQDAFKAKLVVEDPVHDRGIANGALMIHMDDVYNGVPNKMLPADVTIRKNGVALTGYDWGVSGSKPVGDTNKNYFIYR